MTGATRAALLAGALLALGLAGCSDGGDLTVDAPTAEERREITSQLTRAAEAQGLCFGWRLDGSGASHVGSNLGESAAVDSDPQRCPRWVEVAAVVDYVPESSESEDSASIQVGTSPGLNTAADIRAKLGRFGLDEEAFVDDPSTAIMRAALVLPLLAAESGAADPAPSPSASATAVPRALEPVGGDFWRDRWGFVLAAAGMLFLAVLLVLLGVVLRRRRRGRTRVGPPRPVRAAGGGAAPAR